MDRRTFLGGSAASVTALGLPLPAFAASPLGHVPKAPIRRVPYFVPIVTAIEDALHVPATTWDYPQLQAECFGISDWSVTSTSCLRMRIFVGIFDSTGGDPVMWDRVCLWAEIGIEREKKFGSDLAAWKRWTNEYEPIWRYLARDLMLTGSPANLRHVLRDLEAL